MLLVNALLLILFLSDTYGGRVHDKRIADATPYPLPARSRLLQDLSFLAFTLPQVEILMPAKKPQGEELIREQQRANQALNQRRLRIEHVNSSVKRCRIVKDRLVSLRVMWEHPRHLFSGRDRPFSLRSGETVAEPGSSRPSVHQPEQLGGP